MKQQKIETKTYHMENGTYIEVEEVYRDEEIYVERYDIKNDDGSIITSSFITKELSGSVIKHDFRKPEWLIREDKLKNLLFSRLS